MSRADSDDDVDDKPRKVIVLDLSDDDEAQNKGVFKTDTQALRMSHPYISLDDTPSFGAFNVAEGTEMPPVYYDDDATDTFKANEPIEEPFTLTVAPKLDFQTRIDSAFVPVPLFSVSVDARSYLNEVNSIRRVSLWAIRWHGLLSIEPTGIPVTFGQVASRGLVQPVNVPFIVNSENTRQAILSESMLALEYASPFLVDTHNVFEHGDRHGFSSTGQFSVGRAVVDKENPEDSVPRKRQNTTNDPDLAPESLEAAAYQHSFSFAAGATDAVLPFVALSKRSIALSHTETQDMLADFAEFSDRIAIAKDVESVLAKTASGTAKFFGRLSRGRTTSATKMTDYRDLLYAGDMQFVDDVVRTPIEQVRATANRDAGVAIKGQIKDRYTRTSTAINDEDDQQARSRKSLPRLEALATMEDAFEVVVRKESFDGPFTIRGSLTEYSLSVKDAEEQSVTGLRSIDLNTGGRSLTEWLEARVTHTTERIVADSTSEWRNKLRSVSLAAKVRLERKVEDKTTRRIIEELGVEDELRAPVNPRVVVDTLTEAVVNGKRRRLRRLGETALLGDEEENQGETTLVGDEEEEENQGETKETIQATGKEKRKAGVEDGPLSSESLREDKDDDESDDGIGVSEPSINNAEGIEREAVEEGWAMQGVQLRPTVDRHTPWLLDVENTPRSVLGIPLGWSAEVALRALDRVYTESRNNAQINMSTLWRRPDVWITICQLALYAKLVPDLNDEVEFPAEARHALTDTMVLVGRRIRNQIDLQQNTIAYYQATQRSKEAGLRRAYKKAEDELKQRLAAARREGERNLAKAEEGAERSAVELALAAQIAQIEEEGAKVLTPIATSQQVEESRDNVPVDSLPYIFTIQFLSEEQSRYVQAARDNEAQGVVYNGAQRMALALMYATVGKMPTSSREPLSVKPLADSVPNTTDSYRFFPLDRLLSPEAIENAFDDATSQRGIVIINQLASDLGPSGEGFIVNVNNLLPVNAGTNLRRLIDREIGSPPLMRDAETLAAYEIKRLVVLGKLASVLQRTLGTFTPVKRIYLVLPSVSTEESRGIARAMYNDIFTSSGAFSLVTIIQRHEMRIEEIKRQARTAVTDRGSVLLLANAAQQHANEHFALSRVAFDESAPVRVNFNLASEYESLPDGRYNRVPELPVTVDEAGSRALYTSDLMLGGGRTRVSSIPLSYSADAEVNSDRKSKINVLNEFLKDNDARLVELTAELADSNLNEELRTTTEAEQKSLLTENKELRRQVNGLETLIEAELRKQEATLENWVPFFYVFAPFSVLTVISRVVQDPRTAPAIRGVCQALVTWFLDAPGGRALQQPEATLESFVAYLQQLAKFESQINEVVGLPLNRFTPPAGFLFSRGDMLERAHALLTLPIERSCVLGIADELTRPDMRSILPFSGLAALEETPPFGDEVRLNLRDKMMAIWYRMGADLSWKRLGYMDHPFNTNRQIVMPNSRYVASAFDSLQALHFSVRLELRRLVRLRDGVVANYEKQIEVNGRELVRKERVEDGAGEEDDLIQAGADAGDDDAEDESSESEEKPAVVEAPKKKNTGKVEPDDVVEEDEGDSDDESQMTPFANSRELIEIRRSVVEMRTLLNAIEKEMGRLVGAYTVWFDLHVINAGLLQSETFAASVENELVVLYDSITAGNKIGLVSLLAQDRFMPLDPRAQFLFDKLAKSTARSLKPVGQDANHHMLEFERTFVKRIEKAETDEKSNGDKKKDVGGEEDDDEEELDETNDGEFLQTINEQFTLLAKTLQSAAGPAPPGLADPTVGRMSPAVPMPTGKSTEDRTKEALEKARYELARYNFVRRGMQGGSDIDKQRAVEGDVETKDEKEARWLVALETQLRRERRRQNKASTTAKATKLQNAEKDKIVAKLEELDKETETLYNQWRAEFESDAERMSTMAALVKGLANDTALLVQARAADPHVVATIQRLEKSQEARRFSLRLGMFSDAKLARVMMFEERIARDIDRKLRLQRNVQIYKRKLVKFDLTDASGFDVIDLRRRRAARDEIVVELAKTEANLETTKKRIDESTLDIRALMSPYQYHLYRESLARAKAAKEKAEREMTSVVDREMRRLLFGSDLSHEEREEEDDDDEEDNKTGNLGRNTKLHPPLGRHKVVTISGVLKAVELVEKTHVDADVRRDFELLKVPVDEWDEFAAHGLEYVVYLIKRSRTINSSDLPLSVPLGSISDTTRKRVLMIMSSIVRGAVRRVVEARITVDRANGALLTSGIEDTEEFASKVIAKTAAAFQEKVTGATVSIADGKRAALSYAQEAAIVILYKRFTDYKTALDARETLMALGTKSLVLAFGNDSSSRANVPVVLIRLLTPAAIERAKLLLQIEIEKQHSAAKIERMPELWAVAHMAAAPQSLRIGEIVMWYCVAGRCPIPNREAANVTLPYFQYDVAASKKPKRVSKKKKKEEEEAMALDQAPVEPVKPAATEQESLSALGRVLTFNERKKALGELSLRHSRVSFSCGLHNSQPSSTDLYLAAMCVQLLRFWIDAQTEFMAAGAQTDLDKVWHATQTTNSTSRGDSTTLAIAKLPSARKRLWAHLVMYFGRAGSLFPFEMRNVRDLGAALCTLPVFHHMRAVDIRLLALVVLGFDVSSRVDNRLDDDQDDDAVRMPANYAWSRGHAGKFVLARAYYLDQIDSMFRVNNAKIIEHEIDKGLKYLVVSGDDGKIQGRFRKVALNRKLTAVKFDKTDFKVLASLSQAELVNAVDKNIVSQWTRKRAMVDLDHLGIGSAQTALEQIALLSSANADTQTRLSKNIADAAFLTYVHPDKAQELGLHVDSVVDADWLHVPRASLLSALITRALTDISDDKQPLDTESSGEWKKRNIMDALEKIVGLADDSTHLLIDDAPQSNLSDLQDKTPDREKMLKEMEAQQQMELDLLQQERNDLDDEEENGDDAENKTPEKMAEAVSNVAKQEALAKAAVPSSTLIPSTDVASWRRILEKKIRELFGAPASFEGILVGASQKKVGDDISLSEEVADPFAPVPVSKELMFYANEVMFLNDIPDRLWSEVVVPIIVALDAVFTQFKTNGVDLQKVSIRDSIPKVIEWIDNPANALSKEFDSSRKELFLMLARAELERIAYWSRTPDKLIAASQSVDGKLYQPWHVLLFDAMQYHSEPKNALAWYLSKLADTDENKATIADIRALLTIKVSPKQKLAYERYVPVYKRLEFLFVKQPTKAQRDKAAKNGSTLDESITALPFDASEERFDLWAMLLAPLSGRVILRIQTTDSTSFGATYSWVHPPTMASNTKAAACFYAPNYAAAYQEEVQAEFAKTVRLHDTSRVMVLHSHEFANSEKDKGRAAKFRFASKYTSLTRWRALATAPEQQAADYSVFRAMDRMAVLFKELPNCVSLNVKIPYVAPPLPPVAHLLTQAPPTSSTTTTTTTTDTVK